MAPVQVTNPLFLGLDLSTQQIKAVIIQGDATIVNETAVHFDNDLPHYKTTSGTYHGPGEGEVTSPVGMWLEAIDLLFERLHKAGVPLSDVVAISGAGQQHGSVYWSANAEGLLSTLDSKKTLREQLFPSAFTVERSPIWQDHSTEEDCKLLEDAIGGPQALADLSGSRAYERFTGTQISKIRRLQPAVYEATARISLVSSFISSVFLGKYAPIEVSDASGMNLMDISLCKWDVHLLEVCGGTELRDKLGPEPATGGTNLGKVSKWWVERWGLNPGCIVAPFTGDNPATVMSLSAPGDAVLSLGTSTTFLLSIPPSDIPPKRFTSSHLLAHPTTSHGQIAMLCYKNGALARENVRNQYANGDWEEFNKQVESAGPGSAGHLALYFPLREIIPAGVQGEYYFTVSGPEKTPKRVETIPDQVHCRAILESQFLSIRSRIAAILPPNAPHLHRLVISGGSSANPVIRQIAADIFGMDVYVSSTKEAAAMGGALLAKYAWWKINNPNGTFEDMTGGEPAGTTRVAKAGEEARKIYDGLADAYTQSEEEVVRLTVVKADEPCRKCYIGFFHIRFHLGFPSFKTGIRAEREYCLSLRWVVHSKLLTPVGTTPSRKQGDSVDDSLVEVSELLSQPDLVSISNSRLVSSEVDMTEKRTLEQEDLLVCTEPKRLRTDEEGGPSAQPQPMEGVVEGRPPEYGQPKTTQEHGPEAVVGGPQGKKKRHDSRNPCSNKKKDKSDGDAGNKKPRRDRRRATKEEEEANREKRRLEEEQGIERAPRLPKRQSALLIGFCGSGYSGMQIQPEGTKTIEGTLFNALVKAGAVSQDNADDPVKVALARAARTDAGVHAAGNVVSLKMISVVPGVTDLVARVNEELPPEIRFWGFVRVQNSFNARLVCDSRKYTYFFPSYLLLPPQPGSGMDKNMKAHVSAGENTTTPLHPFWQDAQESATREEEVSRKRMWRVGSEPISKLREAAKRYEGTHNFHNFTVGRDFKDRSNFRFMRSITVKDPVVYGETEWVSVLFHGQSFMLHQIRKMMAALVLSCRTGTPPGVIDELYKAPEVFVPKMPSLGLLLEEPLFSSYNERVKLINEKLEPTHAEYRPPIDFDLYREKIVEFKEKFIYKNMREIEDRDGLFDAWARSVDCYAGNDLLYLNPQGTIPAESVIHPGPRRSNPFREKRVFDITAFPAADKVKKQLEEESEGEEEEEVIDNKTLAETEG